MVRFYTAVIPRDFGPIQAPPIRLSIRAKNYEEFVGELDRKSLKVDRYLGGLDYLVSRVHKEKQLEDAASERDARKVKDLQRDPEPYEDD